MSKTGSDNHRLVYSTEHGTMCGSCGHPKSSCRCKKTSPPPPSGGSVIVGRSTKGRKGKGVTTITGLPLDADGLKTLSKTLKQKCGTGGTVKQGVIEIQGDHRDLLVRELKQMGYQVKRSGG